jgi:hypothetical protein
MRLVLCLRSRKLLYFYPDGDLAGAEIVLATLTEPLVVLRGVSHLRLAELRLEYGHADGIVAQNVEHVEIAGCVVANLAGCAGPARFVYSFGWFRAWTIPPTWVIKTRWNTTRPADARLRRLAPRHPTGRAFVHFRPAAIRAISTAI